MVPSRLQGLNRGMITAFIQFSNGHLSRKTSSYSLQSEPPIPPAPTRSRTGQSRRCNSSSDCYCDPALARITRLRRISMKVAVNCHELLNGASWGDCGGPDIFQPLEQHSQSVV